MRAVTARESNSPRASLAVLVSGRGSNLEALAKAAGNDYQIKLVVSDKEAIEGLKVAARYGLASLVIKADADFEARLLQAVAGCRLLCLAGFMRILSAEFIAAAPPIINIHPSLLPKYKGLRTHRRALEAGEKVSGCTVHRVTAELDGGEILGQTEIPIRADDDERSLAARVLAAEHELYPKMVKRALATE